MTEEGKYMVCNNEKVNDVKRNTNLKGSINSDYCIDDTQSFINDIDINKKATLKDALCVDINGKKYYQNKQNKIIHKFNEESVAEWIQKDLHKDVEYLFDITEVENVRLGDYRIDNNEIWELKTIKGNGKRTLDSAVKDNKEQALTFILDLTYSQMEDIKAIKQTMDVFRKREWINRIILKRNDNIIKVFKKRN